MRILITNRVLASYTGTEIVVRDLARIYQQLGHVAMVYTPQPGVIAEEIARSGVEVVDDPARLSAEPEILHCHHTDPALAALRTFVQIPALYVCHDASHADDAPFYFPRFMRYVAVDQRCLRRLEAVPEIPRERCMVIPNAVDMERFKPRVPLPERPRRALLFSNYATEDNYLPLVRRVCRSQGIELEVRGAGVQCTDLTPEQTLPEFELVFAKGRCALEAMAVGAAVIVCDVAGIGGMVTAENFDGLRALNFGQGTLTQRLSEEILKAEIARYDRTDAARVTERVRKEASLRDAADAWIATYQRCITEYSAQQGAASSGQDESDIIASQLRARTAQDNKEPARSAATGRAKAILEQLRIRFGRQRIKRVLRRWKNQVLDLRSALLRD